MTTTDTRKPYSGKKLSLVLAFDVGTTFSGVSYAVLEPKEIPKIQSVTRFPGQEPVSRSYKVPTIMYYDQEGNMTAGGAEAEGLAVAELAEDCGWTKAELFKLRLWPQTMEPKMNGMHLPPLPEGKSAVQVFGDYLGYLFRCAKKFIIYAHASGAALWHAVEEDLQFVLSHPNGWEGAQHTKMRRAAIYGGLIPDTNAGKARVRFVTEGEASLHACILSGLADGMLMGHLERGFLIAHAGGVTLDISSYAVRGTAPLEMEEISPPDCAFAGSVFVTRRARTFFEDKLRGSKYDTQDSIERITKRFDDTTKLLFCDKKDTQYVQFGSPLDKDSSAGIRQGQLKLTGAEVAEFFEPSIKAVTDSIKQQVESTKGFVRSVWLVGGFSASPWLFSQLQERLEPLGIDVSRLDNQTSKVVADGAIGFYCDPHVCCPIIRRGLNATRSELHKYRSDATKFAEMYRALERALEEANEALRSRDEEIEVLKRERDFAMADLNSRRSTRSPDNHVDVFEGASFDDRHSIITDLMERSVLMTEALHPPTPPIQRRLLEPTSIHANANANMAPLPNATVHAIPDMPTKVPAPSPTLPTDVVATAAATAFAHYHRDQNQSFRPKLRRQRANIVRAIPKKTDIPVSETDHRITDDRNEEDVGNIGGEGLDNRSWKPVNVDNANHDGPRSIKTLSKKAYSMTMTGSSASLKL